MNQEIYNQMELVRQSGAVNMMDRHGVQRVADEMGFAQLVTHLEEADSSSYMELLNSFPDEEEVSPNA